MRTMFQGGWIVGHDGDTHAIVRDGVCVIQGDRVVHVGSSYKDTVDRTIDTTGMLVSPGLITTHVHPSNNTTNFLFRDRGRPEAVSYTHLRAHETDSYLVCRLLLEKK